MLRGGSAGLRRFGSDLSRLLSGQPAKTILLDDVPCVEPPFLGATEELESLTRALSNIDSYGSVTATSTMFELAWAAFGELMVCACTR